jgi:hypothetical protein
MAKCWAALSDTSESGVWTQYYRPDCGEGFYAGACRRALLLRDPRDRPRDLDQLPPAPLANDPTAAGGRGPREARVEAITEMPPATKIVVP